LEIPSELKSDLQRALLGPLSLATEFYGALLPGCVLLTLICIKRGWMTLVLSYPLLGYKTKVIAALVAAYVSGKVTLSLVSMLRELGTLIARKRNELKERNKPADKNPSVLQAVTTLISKALQSSNKATAFLAGLVGGSVLANKSQVMDHFTAYDNLIYFHVNTGLAFAICSLIPGDGNFRLLEGAAAAILLLRGITYILGAGQLTAGLLGVILNTYLADLSLEQVSAGLKTVWSLFVKLSVVPPTSAPATPTPSTSPPPAPLETPTSPIAMPASVPGASHPEAPVEEPQSRT
jgi:hypothetical protein